jgi:hypothetical protein
MLALEEKCQKSKGSSPLFANLLISSKALAQANHLIVTAQLDYGTVDIQDLQIKVG